MLRRIILIFYSLFATTLCWADLPLTIEDLLTEKKQFRLEFGVSYANADRNNINTRFALVQTGPESFILLPVSVSNQR